MSALDVLLVAVVGASVVGVILGVVIALRASRRAPEGYEDQSGFHVGSKERETLVDSLQEYGWLSDEVTSAGSAESTASR